MLLFLDRSGIVPTGRRKASVRIATVQVLVQVASVEVVRDFVERFHYKTLDWESSRLYITSLLHQAFRKVRKRTRCSSSFEEDRPGTSSESSSGVV